MAKATWKFDQEQIHIEELQVHCIIGLHPEERVHEQSLVISMAIPSNFSRAAKKESLEHTVDYGEMARETRAFLKEGQFRLLESLGRSLGAHLCETFSLQAMSLHVRKREAIHECAGPAVSLRITRGGKKK